MSENVVAGPESWRQNVRKSLAEEAELAEMLPVDPGGGEPHNPGMEARVAVLEEIASSVKVTLAELRLGQDKIRDEVRVGFEAARSRHDRDFRITFGAIITVALGLASLVAKGFKWL